MKESGHIPVLLQEVLRYTNPQKGEVVFDGTLGGAGHAKEFVKAIGKTGTLVATDKDKDAIARGKKTLKSAKCKVALYESGFEEIDNVLTKENLEEVNIIFLDLGLSSNLLADPSRGFSFQTKGPLDMRFSEKQNLNAAQIVNSWKESELEELIRVLGEERFARRIAHAIVVARKMERIISTEELASIVANAVPKGKRQSRTHPATKTFQALRIVVNGELTALNKVLVKGWKTLVPNGRFAIISFHSIEDRIVKHFFKEKVINKEGVLLAKKPVVPSQQEVKNNPRSRSAKLRIIQKKETK